MQRPSSPRDQDNRTTPSYVAFTDTERLIRDQVLSEFVWIVASPFVPKVAINSTNTIFDAKRLIGRKFNDPTVQADMKHRPFQVQCSAAQCSAVQCSVV